MASKEEKTYSVTNQLKSLSKIFFFSDMPLCIIITLTSSVLTPTQWHKTAVPINIQVVKTLLAIVGAV